MADFSLDTNIDEDGEMTYLDRLEDGGAPPDEKFISTERDSDVQQALSKVRKRIGDLGWTFFKSG